MRLIKLPSFLQVDALEVAVNGGTKVSSEELDASAELLMRELLKLDGIEAEGEAKVQRKTEVSIFWY